MLSRNNSSPGVKSGHQSPVANANEQNYSVPSAVALTLRVKVIVEEHQKRELIKENDGLLQAINELYTELQEQQENILSTIGSSTTIQHNLNSMCATIVDIFNYFDELQNTTVMFLTKPKLKRKSAVLTQSLRSKGTQLLTNVTLELLQRKQPELEDGAHSGDTVYHLPKFYKYYYGVAGAPVNYVIAFTKAKEAAETGHPRAMLMLSRCYYRGHGVEISTELGREWLDRAVKMDLPEAKKELAELLLDSIQDRKAACVRLISPDGKSANEIKEEHAKTKKEAEEKDTDSIAESSPREKAAPSSRSDDKLLRQAIELLLDAARGHVVHAETLMGQLSEEAGVYDKAVQWYNASIKGECPHAMNRLGLLYYYGKGGLDRQPLKAYRLFLDAAKAGNVAAYNNVGMCIEYGQGAPISVIDALNYYLAGAQMGCPDSMYSAGYLLIRQYIATLRSIQGQNSTNTALSQSLSIVTVVSPQESSSWNDRPSIYRLSVKDREELDRISSQGIQWLRAAAEHGVVEATYQLGRVYEQGIGVPVDMNAAFAQYEWAALRGSAKAALVAGDMRYAGAGTVEDPFLAAEFYRQAAIGGFPQAMNSLGILLEAGVGSSDQLIMIQEAAKWFLEAARLETPQAAINLCNLLAKHSLSRIQTVGGEILTVFQVKEWLENNLSVPGPLIEQFESALAALNRTLLENAKNGITPDRRKELLGHEIHEPLVKTLTSRVDGGASVMSNDSPSRFSDIGVPGQSDDGMPPLPSKSNSATLGLRDLVRSSASMPLPVKLLPPQSASPFRHSHKNDVHSTSTLGRSTSVGEYNLVHRMAANVPFAGKPSVSRSLSHSELIDAEFSAKRSLPPSPYSSKREDPRRGLQLSGPLLSDNNMNQHNPVSLEIQ